ncbi:MAG TPA: MBOAT family O-acyltransferase, partial [Bacteroidia bacterium]|nr:MBOAT family O-acyltransferase [Bacteroidia bacterium]
GIMFTIQMYCDFSGYSDIALGTAKLLGFDLLRNFNFPFFSTSMTDFWRKWHISLTSWITDYLYTPISFQKRDWGLWGIVYAAIISFTLSGLWHGANWPSVLWGLLHGLALGYEVLTKKKRKKWAKQFNPVLYSVLSGLLVFMFWTFGQLVFRATSLEHLGGLLAQMASVSLFTLPSLDHTAQAALGWALLMFGIEWFQREKEYGLSIGNLNYMLRWTIYAALIMLIFSSDNLNNQNEFIYFQF